MEHTWSQQVRNDREADHPHDLGSSCLPFLSRFRGNYKHERASQKDLSPVTQHIILKVAKEFQNPFPRMQLGPSQVSGFLFFVFFSNWNFYHDGPSLHSQHYWPVIEIFIPTSYCWEKDRKGRNPKLGLCWGLPSRQEDFIRELNCTVFSLGTFLTPEVSSFFKNFFNWSIVNLQYYVNLCCTAKWVSYTHIYILFLYSFPLWFIKEYWT